ncbi:uroporphyrinogen-III C-methyltransferase [Arenimonas daejeonensis]|uniref:uroporphyrinogen-III C-methyltransferase n=1 Tax=Arenimonas daejeonensis TaxID=370777 RepID=UPI0011BE2829|nr:uroporphyrinogen-III C-methyltransferase [Arenimonas daejeonensis]
MDTVLDTSPETPPVRRRSGALGWLLLLVVLVVAGYGGWRAWQAWRPAEDAGPDLSPEALDARLLEAEQALATLRRTHQGLDQRLTDTSARTGLLRDEVLGVGQRAAILEDNLRELSAQASEGREALRLDEAELLLSLAQARLAIAGDVEGAIRATVMARDVLAPLTDPQFISLRQTLGQELSALRALPADPRRIAAAELDALQSSLGHLASRAPGAPTMAGGSDSRWQRLLDAVVQVRPSSAQDLISPSDRATGEAALGLELALARTALDRRDQASFRAGLERIDQWLQRLYAESNTLRVQRERLVVLASLSLTPDLPVQGAGLQQLRSLRQGSRIERP